MREDGRRPADRRRRPRHSPGTTRSSASSTTARASGRPRRCSRPRPGVPVTSSVRVAHVLGGADDFTGRLEHYADRIAAGEPIAVPVVNQPATYVHVEEIADFLAWAAGAGLHRRGQRGLRRSADDRGPVRGDRPRRSRRQDGPHRVERRRDLAVLLRPLLRHGQLPCRRRSGSPSGNVGEWLPEAVAETLAARKERRLMRYRTLGDLRVSAIGLGAMPLSIEGRPDERQALATVHAALDAGVTLIDTADSYHPPGGEPGHNELLVARALAAYGGDTADVLVATKGGRGRPADGGWTVDAARPAPKTGRRGLPEAARRARRSASTSCTSPIRPSRSPSRSARCASCSTRARSGWPGSPTWTSEQIRRPARSSATGSSRCRTATRPPYGTARPSCGCVRSWDWRSCRGARSAASPAVRWTGRRRGPRPPVAYAPSTRWPRERGVSPQQVCLAWLSASRRR